MSGTTYTEATSEAKAYLSDAKTRYHDQRLDGVRVGMLMAYAPEDKDTGDPKGPALKRHGVPCLALVRIVPTKDRVAGMPDAMIYVDGDAWRGLTHSERLALLDHELEHIDFPTNRGEDCHGRPKLKIKPHDHEFGWFDAVAERHGSSSQEVRQATRFVNIFGQIYLPGLGDDDSTAEQMEIAARPIARAIEAKSAKARSALAKLGDTKVTMTPTEMSERLAAAGDRPAGMLVHDELIAAIGKVKAKDLQDRVNALLEAEGGPVRMPTVAALLWAEGCRASAKPRSSLLAFFERTLDFHRQRAEDIEVSDADCWAALLLCYSVGAPKTEHVEAGVPLIVDLAVIRYVQTVESGRGKSARPAVIALCEERLAELYDQGGAA